MSSARPRRMRRAVMVGLAGVLCSVLINSPQGLALPKQDLQQVEAQVRELEMQAGAAHEEAEQARLRLSGIQDELGIIEGRLERERTELRSAQGNLADIARSIYASGGIDPTLEVLLADNPTEFLSQAAVMSQLQASQVAQLREAQTSRLRLAQTEAEFADRETLAEQARADLAAAERRADSRLEEARGVLANLREEERMRLAEIQRERRANQLEEARQAAVDVADLQTSGGSTSNGSGSGQAGGGYTGGSRAQAAIEYALSQVGDPYSFSANPPQSWDCSKLTAAAWAQAGVGLTALSYTQWDQTRRVPVSEIQPGDLVFYFGRGAHHVAMYIGNGKMVSASNPSDGVEIIDFLGPWYRERFSGVGRVVG